MNIQKRISHFIAKEFLQDTSKSIPEDLDLINTGIVNSLGILRIVAFLEEEMQVVIKPEAIVPENLNSICAISRLVNPLPLKWFNNPTIS